MVVPVDESEFLPPQREQMKGWVEEVEKDESHRWAVPVASVPPAPSAHPHANHTDKSAPPAP